MSTISDEELTRFGIGFADEGFHPSDPSDASWNESWFWDWYDEAGTQAGHCRIGCLPNQHRVWLWLYVLRDGEWICVEQPFLDFGLIRRPDVAFDQPGLSFAWSSDDPLRRGRLRVTAHGRVVSGKRTGRVVPVDIDLVVHGIAAVHSTGAADADGHRSEGFDARRFEQPITVDGTVAVDRVVSTLQGRGERDHSWGPRYWQIEWSFLVLNGVDRQLQCVEVRFPGDGTVEVGYLNDADGAHDLASVDLRVERDIDLGKAARGSCTVAAHDGTTMAFDYEAIATHEMDLSHVVIPNPPVSRYRRSVIRAVPRDDGPALIGWLEDHVMPEGTADLGDDAT